MNLAFVHSGLSEPLDKQALQEIAKSTGSRIASSTEGTVAFTLGQKTSEHQMALRMAMSGAGYEFRPEQDEDYSLDGPPAVDAEAA